MEPRTPISKYAIDYIRVSAGFAFPYRSAAAVCGYRRLRSATGVALCGFDMHGEQGRAR